MNRLNNRGFTLVELIATIVVLALVMTIGSYTITGVLKRSKEADYELLITNIKSGVEAYYQECKYSGSTYINCPSVLEDGYYSIKLGSLVEYGYLKGNSKGSDDKVILVNPVDKVDILECLLKYKYSNGSISIVAVNPTGSCPTSY